MEVYTYEWWWDDEPILWNGELEGGVFQRWDRRNYYAALEVLYSANKSQGTYTDNGIFNMDTSEFFSLILWYRHDCFRMGQNRHKTRLFGFLGSHDVEDLTTRRNCINFGVFSVLQDPFLTNFCRDAHAHWTQYSCNHIIWGNVNTASNQKRVAIYITAIE
jgi:hypothetical protein